MENNKTNISINKVNNVSNKKSFTYLVFSIFFVLISILSIMMIQDEGNGTGFNIFKIFHWYVFIELAILMFLLFLFDTLRFYYMLKSLNVHMKFPYMFRLSFINVLVSNITPFTTGGGIGQIYFLNKKGVSISDSSAAVLIRTITSIGFYFIIIPVILLFNQDLLALFPNRNNLVITIVTLSIYGIALFFFYNLIKNTKILKKLIFGVVSYLNRKNIVKRQSFRNIIRDSFRSVDNFSKNVILFFKGEKKYVFLSIFYTPLYILTLCAFPAVLIKGLKYGVNYDVSSFSIVSLQVMLTFVTYFVPTPGATGAAEGSFYYIFQEVVKGEYIASVTFLWRFFTIYLGILIGLFISYIELIRIKRNKNKLNN